VFPLQISLTTRASSSLKLEEPKTTPTHLTMPAIRATRVASDSFPSSLRRSSRKSINSDLTSDGDHDNEPFLAPVSATRPRRQFKRPSIKNVASFTKEGRGSKPIHPASQALVAPIAISGVHLNPTIVFDTFWRFAAERKAIDDRRRRGLPSP
jgi:hypothetical protein